MTGIVGLKYNGSTYYYIKNLQDDIIGILDSNYNQIVTYKYDSWGKILSIKDSQGNDITDSTNIGIINSFRYRSYYYDEETGFYYLNSRYYNPGWGRFINTDTLICSNQDLISYNLYSYVSNNPIMFSDPTGQGVFSYFAGKVKAAVETAIKTVTKVIKEVVGKVINVNYNVSSGKSRSINGVFVGVESGTNLNVSKSLIGDDDSLIKIDITKNTGAFDTSVGVEVNAPIVKPRLDIGTKSFGIAVGFEYDDKTRYGSIGIDGYNVFIQGEESNFISAGVDESAFVKFDFDMRIPIAIYAVASGAYPSLQPTIPGFAY